MKKKMPLQSRNDCTSLPSCAISAAACNEDCCVLDAHRNRFFNRSIGRKFFCDSDGIGNSKWDLTGLTPTQGFQLTLQRGSTYYLASGNYNSYNFTTATSGTSLITIKKASDSDHGTETGWNAGYGSSGQAVFSGGMSLTAGGFVTIDGAYEYGFKFVVPDGGQGFFVGGTSSAPRSNITLRYIDIAGTHGDVGHNFTADTRGIYVHPYTVSLTPTLRICWCSIVTYTQFPH